MALVSKTFSQIITFTRASTATYFDSTGTLQSAAIDAQRLDYNPSTLAAQGLLIEESRANLLLQSQDFATTWAASGTSPAVVTANTTTSLDGTVNADTVSGTGANSDRVQQTVTVAASTTYVISFFVKNSTSVQSRFHVSNPNSGTTNSETYITWSGSAITGFTNTGTTVGVAVAYPNNWWRVYFAFTTNASDAGTATVRFYPNSTGADATFKAVFLWGAQLEAGAFPTSYIPTTTATVTRSEDRASINTMSPWYNASASTIYAEYFRPLPTPAGTFPRAVDFVSTATSDKLSINQLDNRPTVSSQNLYPSGLSWPFTSVAADANNVIKHAIAATVGSGRYAVNGTLGGSDYAIASIPTFDQVVIGSGKGFLFNSTLNGWIRRITYYPRRLSNAELIAITA